MSSSITGTPVTYGQGGAKAKENAAADAVGANTGTGGQGSRYGNNSGAGGSGIVIVRVKSMLPVVNRTAEVYVGYPQPLTDIDGTVASVKSDDTSKATVANSGNNVTVTPVAAGTTTVTVTTDTTVYNYAVTVKNQREFAQTVDLAKGPNSATIHAETFDQPPTVTTSPAASVATAAVSGNTATITAAGAGTTTAVVTGLMDGIPTQITYTIKVTAKTSDVVQVGEGYVTYEGATATRVGDELVLTFSDPTAAGSFEVPAPFTAKIDVLAVGGGGAGGTVASGRGQGGGGGGAGGYTYRENVKLAVGTYNVSVGAGGKVQRDEELDVGLTGALGRPSYVSDGFGYTYASASGGGGGGAPMAQGNDGVAGGSGGGAAWYGRKAGVGGSGVDGQGHAGGTPTTYTNGGAGGGAAGVGGDWDEVGAGKVNDITGMEVTYAAGGAGGQGSGTMAATAGSGPGFGGNGGNGGLGANGGLAGAGGDGVVIVRIKDVSKSVKVPLPTEEDILNARYEWEEGKTYRGIDYEGKTFTAADGQMHNWSDAISYVDYVGGVTNVTCSLDGETKVGIGYYNLTVYLKDGYVWNTEPDDPDSYGSTDGYSHRWRIVEDLDNVDAEINVKKSVVNQNGSNATVRVEAFSSPEISGGGTLNVLLLGTACTSHGLDTDVLKASIDAISPNANVDWYIYNNLTLRLSGHRDVGGPAFTDSLPTASSSHNSLSAFYNKLYELLCGENAVKYDYIIFETDGGRIAQKYGTQDDPAVSDTVQRAVAEALLPFYQSGSVIWVFDNGYDCVKSTTANAYFKNPNGNGYVTWGADTSIYEYGDLIYQYYGDQGAKREYRPSNGFLRNSGESNQYLHMMNDTQWRGFIGIFDPELYLSHHAGGNDYVETKTVSAKTSSNSSTLSSTTMKAGHDNPNQMFYDDADKLAEYLSAHIKPKPYNLDFMDKIVGPAQGLTLRGVTIMVCTNGTQGVASTDPNDWVDLMRWDPATGKATYLDTTHRSGIPGGWMAVEATSNLVTACFSNVDFQVWSKLDIDVVDDGKFRTSEGATYNNITGQWEKNPNEGLAVVQMMNVDSGIAIGVDGKADTAIPMKYNAYKVKGTAEHGSIFVNGSGGGDGYYVSEGSTVPVLYRGNGGYMIASVTIDGTTWGKEAADPAHQDINAALTNGYTFVAIASDHEVEVVYERFYGAVVSSPVTNAYDGAAHLIQVELGDDWNSPYDTEIRYSLVENADPGAYMNEADFLEYCRTNNLAQTVAQSGANGVQIFYEVFAKQPGYGENFSEGWVWVDMGLRGSDYSVITPRELVVTPDRARVIKFGDPFPDTGYSVTGFVNDEGMEMLDTDGWTVAPDDYVAGVSGEGQYQTHMEGVDASDVHGGNYKIVVEKGLLDVVKTAMEIGGVPQGPNLNPEDPNIDTGVDRVERVYDGTATNLMVDVTLPEGSANYEIYYSIADANGDPTTWVPMDTPSTMIDVGTNKVWYTVKLLGDSESYYFPATNYSYVVTLPRPITVQAASDSKPYDGTALVNPNATLVAGDLAEGDAITAKSVVGSQLSVGTSPNTMNSVTIKNQNGAGRDVTANYAVTLLHGTLEVTVAPIEIGGTEHSIDPDMPNDYGDTGVDDVEMTYDGTGTNIVVVVTNPDPDTVNCTISYSTNGVDWVENLSITNAGTYQVWFRVDPPEGTGYVPVENYGYVTIAPREVTVTAEDRETVVGYPEPTYAAKVEGVVPGEQDQIATLILYSVDCPTFDDVKNTVGVYDDAIVATGEANQGNYHVTYYPGNLTIAAKQRVVSLWIVDHADAGAGKVHLAFRPTLNVGTLEAADLSTWDIKVKCAATEAALANATLRSVSLRGGTGTQHLGRGWVWITVDVPDDGTGPEKLWKIVVELP